MIKPQDSQSCKTRVTGSAGRNYKIVCISPYEFEGTIFKLGEIGNHSFGRNIPDNWKKATQEDIINYHRNFIFNHKSVVFNNNWRDITKMFPDNYFDWVIDDIPYGINVGKMAFLTERNTLVKQKNGTKLNPRKGKKSYSLKEWDLQSPGQDYFDEMKRISKNQIIFGVEYVDWEGIGKGRIKWNKGVAEGMSFKSYEMAYCSSIEHTHEIDLLWSGMQQAESLKNPMTQQGNKKLNEKRIHPCHKPILLYKKLAIDFDLKDKYVFCGHNGSGSDRISFYDYVAQFIASEIELEYFESQENRFYNFTNAPKLQLM